MADTHSGSDPDPRLAVGRLVGATVPAVDAATILLVRDAGAIEVFLLERHLQSDFAGGAYVFPGGKVDASDVAIPPARWDGADPAALADRLGTDSPRAALGLLVAAVRETFEEAGVLLARRAGVTVGAADLATDSFVTARRRLNDRADDFDWHAWLEEEDLVLDLGALAFWSWWVTPDGVHRRYDTRFFVAVAPPGQVEGLAHDTVETVSSRWATPADALRAAAADEVTIIYPTRKNLEALARFDSAEAAWRAAAEGRVDQRRIQPVLVEGPDGRPMVRHPDGGSPEPG